MLSLEPTEELWGGVLFSIIHCETLYGKFDLTKKEGSPFLRILWVHIHSRLYPWRSVYLWNDYRKPVLKGSRWCSTKRNDRTSSQLNGIREVEMQHLVSVQTSSEAHGIVYISCYLIPASGRQEIRMVHLTIQGTWFLWSTSSWTAGMAKDPFS